MHSTALRIMSGNRDKTLSIAANCGSLGACCGNTLMCKKLFDQITAKRNSCACASSKSITSYLMSHFKLLRRTRFFFHIALFLHLLAKFIETLFTKVADGHYRCFTFFKKVKHITNCGDACSLKRIEHPNRKIQSLYRGVSQFTSQAATTRFLFYRNRKRLFAHTCNIAQMIDHDLSCCTE